MAAQPPPRARTGRACRRRRPRTRSPSPSMTGRTLRSRRASSRCWRPKARATFFCIGERVRAVPAARARDRARRPWHREPHLHGTATRFSLMGPGAMAEEVRRAQDSHRGGNRARSAQFFRAPAGLRNPFLDAVLARQKLRLVSWTRRGFDTVNPSPQRSWPAHARAARRATSCCCTTGTRRARPPAPRSSSRCCRRCCATLAARARAGHPACCLRAAPHELSARHRRAAGRPPAPTTAAPALRLAFRTRQDQGRSGLSRPCSRWDCSEGASGCSTWARPGTAGGVAAGGAQLCSERAGAWPRGWPAPPRFTSYTGIEINAGRRCAGAARVRAATTGARLEVRKGTSRRRPRFRPPMRW